MALQPQPLPCTKCAQRSHTATLPNMRYDGMIREFGCHTEFVERDVEIKPALERAFDFVRKEYRPAFIEVFIDPDVLQELWATWLIPMFAGGSPWDEVTEGTRKLMAENYPTTSPLGLGYAHPTWAEGIKKYRKENEMEQWDNEWSAKWSPRESVVEVRRR